MASLDDLVAAAERTLTGDVAQELAGVYGDLFVFPENQRLESFPGCDVDLLLLAYENQHICMWGLALEGPNAGRVLVGLEGSDGATSLVYVESIEEFVAARRWDGDCLRGPLVQAQGQAIDAASLRWLESRFVEAMPTYGWPCEENRRFEGHGLKVMIWICEDQTDWYISGSETALRANLPAIAELSDLSAALWSDDEVGLAVLRYIQSGA